MSVMPIGKPGSSVIENGVSLDVPNWIPFDVFEAGRIDPNPKNPIRWLSKCVFKRWEKNDDWYPGLLEKNARDGYRSAGELARDPWLQEWIPIYDVEFLVPLGEAAELLGEIFTFVNESYREPDYVYTVENDGIHLAGQVGPWADCHDMQILSLPKNDFYNLTEESYGWEENEPGAIVCDALLQEGTIEAGIEFIVDWDGHYQEFNRDAIVWSLIIHAHED